MGQPCCVPERAGPRGPRVRGTFLAPGRAWLPCPAVMAVVGKVSSWTARHQEPQLHSSLGCRLAGTSESQPQAYPPPRGLCLSPAGEVWESEAHAPLEMFLRCLGSDMGLGFYWF